MFWKCTVPRGCDVTEKVSLKNSVCKVHTSLISTVDENIIATIKMRNNFCYLSKMVIIPILLSQYWNFLYCSPFSYRSSNFAIVGRAITLEKEPSKKKQRPDTKKDAKRIEINNFTRSNREKSNIAIAILEKWMIGW